MGKIYKKKRSWSKRKNQRKHKLDLTKKDADDDRKKDDNNDTVTDEDEEEKNKQIWFTYRKSKII
jgi:hypothetical protein